MNILIVDDEAIIREWFKMTVDKLGEPFEIVGEASNAEMALQFCEKHKLDLVVTDVKMPGMSGIELLKQLKQKHPNLKVVIFSSYGEFEFAASALKNGATDYILKAEVTLQGLQELLQKIWQDIHSEHHKTSEVNMLQNKLNESQIILRNAYFRSLIEGNPTALLSFSEKMDMFETNMLERQLVVLSLGIIRGEKEDTKLRIKNESLLEHSIINIVDETLKNELNNGCAISYQRNRYLLFMNIYSTGVKSQRELMLLVASRILEHLQRFVGVTATIGISHTYSELKYLPDQIEECNESLEHNYFYGMSEITWYEDIDDYSSQFRLGEKLQQYQQMLNYKVYDDALTTLAGILNHIAAKKAASVKQLRAFALEVVYSSIHRAREERVNEQILNKLHISSHQEIMKCTTFQQLHEWLNTELSQLFGQMKSQFEQYSSSVQKACTYLLQHCDEDISLQQIADYVYLSRNYFSELFKKETGENFNTFLMRVRIEKAMSELKLRKWKIADLADYVGYSNTSYFIKLFKKHTGLSPNEYIDSLNKR